MFFFVLRKKRNKTKNRQKEEKEGERKRGERGEGREKERKGERGGGGGDCRLCLHTKCPMCWFYSMSSLQRIMNTDKTHA